MLELLYADVGDLPDTPERYRLSAYRLDRLGSTKSPMVRKLGMGAELLLQKLAVSQIPEASLPLELFVRDGGRPDWKLDGWYFSLSHSGTVAACVLSDRPVGVDVQKLSPFSEPLVRRFFCPQELSELQQAQDSSYAFTKLWSLKESYVKALGTGLSTPLNSFRISLEPPLLTASGDAVFWHQSVGEYHFAICIPGAEPDLRPDRFEKADIKPVQF